MKLSTPTICNPSRDSNNACARLLPAKPQMPVIRIVIFTAALGKASMNAGTMNLRKYLLEAVSIFPPWIMRLKTPHIADVPDVVANSIRFGVIPRQLPSGDFLAEFDRFEDGTVGVPAASQIVNLTSSRRAEKFPKRRDEIITMNVVAHLFSLVPKNTIWFSADRAFHQESKKTMQLGARMRWTGQTTPSKTSGIHSEITPILLHQQIRRGFAHPK